MPAMSTARSHSFVKFFLLVLWLSSLAARPLTALDGTLTDYPLDYTNPVSFSSDQVYAYSIYTPPGYSPTSGSWPLLVQVHGIGHAGNGTSQLRIAYSQRGAMGHILNGNDLPFRGAIVAAMQQSTTTGPNNALHKPWGVGPVELTDFLVYLKRTFRVDPNRVLLTGWSAGGRAVWDVANFVSRNDPNLQYQGNMGNQLAALAPVCGIYDWPNANQPYGPNPYRLQKLPIWNFHNLDDGTVSVENSRLWLNGIADAKHRTDFPADTTYASNVTGNYPGGQNYTASYSTSIGWTWIAGRGRPLPTDTGYPWWTLSPTGGHNAWDPAYALNSPLWPWIFAQVNTAPSITALANRTVAVGQSTGAMNFTVSDDKSTAAFVANPNYGDTQLRTTATSSNTTLVSSANLVFGGNGVIRNLTVTPAGGLSGSSTITVTVSDGLLTTSTSFVLTVGVRVAGDVTGDGVVNAADIAAVRAAFGTHSWNPTWNPSADLNSDLVVDAKDLSIVLQALPR